MKRILLSLFILSSGLAARADIVGLKNFRELPAALEAATGVSLGDSDVEPVYLKVRTRLPLHGTLAEFSSPMLLGATELAGAFCRRFIKKESFKQSDERIAFTTVDFGRSPEQFDASSRDALITELALLFWQRTPTADENKILTESLTAATAIPGGATSGDLPGVLLVACAEVATSLDFLVN